MYWYQYRHYQINQSKSQFKPRQYLTIISEQAMLSNPAHPQVFGLQKEEGLILESIQHCEGCLLVGWAGVGKTVLIKDMARRHSSQLRRYEYLHASEVVVRGDTGVKQIAQTISRFEEKTTSQGCMLILIVDEIDVLAQFRKVFSEELPNMIQQHNILKRKIVLIGLTNRPQYMGQNSLSYFKNRVQIPLPDEQTRSLMLRNVLAGLNIQFEQNQIMEITKLTHQFTQCDLAVVARAASYIPIKKFMTSKSFKKVGEGYVCCQDQSGEIKKFSQLNINQILLDKVGKAQFYKALYEIKSTFDQQAYKQLLLYIQ